MTSGATEIVALLEAKAKALRDAGVRRLRIGPDGAVDVELAPADVSVERVSALPIEDLDALHDPATYGGRVPGYPRRPRDEDETE